jgi:hypothetical protein
MGIAACILFLLLCFPFGTEYFAPGPLSVGHRQILGSALANERCAACHPGASGSISQWFLSVNTGHEGVTQTELCLKCHHQQLAPETARNPHNLTAEVLRQLTQEHREASATLAHWTPRPSNGGTDLACATCHREHGGVLMTLLTDSQCQTCHQQQFQSFAVGHPDWEQWPYGRGGEITFDHRTHAGQHFATKQTEWNCQQCHRIQPNGEISRTVGYQQACASCHDEPLRQQSQEGFALFQMPMIDIEELTKRNVVMPEWPGEANGLTDLSVPVLMRLLFARDEIPETNIAGAPPEATVRFMRAIRSVAQELNAGGQRILVERFLKQGFPRKSTEALFQNFPIQIVDAVSWWPSDRPTRTATNGSLIRQMKFAQGDLLLPKDASLELLPSGESLEDPLAMTTPSIPPKVVNSAEQLVGLGGWFRDDRKLAIRYRSAGHADPVMKALVELQAASQVTAPVPGMLFKEVPGVAACIECHRLTGDHDQWNWSAHPLVGREDSLTKFSHRSHLRQPILSDCTHCHRVAPAPSRSRLSSSSDSRWQKVGHEFLPLSRTACANCHRENSAGDGCLQCHRYHSQQTTAHRIQSEDARKTVGRVVY